MNIFPNAVGSSSQGADPLVGVYDANMDLNLDLRNLIDGVLRSNRVVTPFQDDEAVVEAQWFVSLRDIAQEILSADVPDDLPHDIYMSSTNSDDKVLELERSNMSRCLLNEAAGRYLRCLFGFKRCLDDRTTEDVEYVSKHFLSLLEKVGESESSKSMATRDELKNRLINDFCAWASSTTFYFLFRSSGPRVPRSFWSDATENKSEIAFRVYTFAKRQSLLEEQGYLGRGVLFPVKWIHELVDWLLLGYREAWPKEKCLPKATQKLAPFDTFNLVEIAADQPQKHILKKNKEVDVIPEELFDYLWLLFGGGPKYMVSGTFELRGMIIKSLKPACFSVAVVFEGFEEHVITLTDVVGRATLLEVIRRASHKLSESPRSAVQNEGDSYIELSPWTDYRVEVRHSGSMKLENPFSVSSLGRMTVAKLLEDVACRSDTSGSQQAHIQLFLYAERPGSSSPGAFSACGLINIGNTCYMNSALQCVLNMRELRRELVSFPLSERVDPLLTSELLELLLQMKSGKICTADPTNLKRAIGLREEQFYTYEQQDAAEFIEVLLDGVHEEMNNVSTKFYRQRSDSDVNFSTRELSEIFWADFLKNNQSFIPELFFHQSVVRFTCSACGKKSAVFENNSTLVVALANPSKRIFSVSVLMHDSDLHTIQVMVPHEADGTISVPALQQEVEAHVKKLIQDQGYLDSSGYAVEHKVDKHRVIVHANPKMPIPVGRKHLCAVLASSVCVTEEASLSPLLDQTSPSLGDAAEEGGGSVATVAEEKGKSDEVTEQRYIWYFFRNLVSGPYDERPKLCRVEKVASDQVVEGSKLKEHILNQSNNLCKHLVRETADLAADSLYSHAGAVPEQSYYASVQSISVYFYKTCDDNGCCLSPDDTTAFGLATSKDLSILLTAESSVLIMYGQYRNTAGTCSRYISPFFYECGYTNNSYCNGDCSVTIDECLQHTFSLESLTGDNAMYCGTCNTLRDGQIERRLFRLPPCLLVSLGRFKVNLQGSTKNCAYVMFDGSLNLAPHLDSESSEKHTTYELVGVVFHRGTLSYGHYTAATRNGPGGEWFFCDDSRVASLKGEPWKYPLAGDAYILCYERQKEGSESDSIIQNKTMQ